MDSTADFTVTRIESEKLGYSRQVRYDFYGTTSRLKQESFLAGYVVTKEQLENYDLDELAHIIASKITEELCALPNG